MANETKNILFMLSSHGTFSDVSGKKQINEYVKHCNEVADNIVKEVNKKVEDMGNVNVYIGYDGDGYYNTPPVTFLFLTVLDKLAEAKPEGENTFKITPIISQVPAYMHTLKDLIEEEEKKAAKEKTQTFKTKYNAGDSWGSYLKSTNYNKTFEETVQLFYIAINNKTQASLEDDKQKVIENIIYNKSNMFHDLKEKLKSFDDKNIENLNIIKSDEDNNYLILVDMGIATECVSANKGVYPLKLDENSANNELYLTKNKIEDGRSEPYGGISYTPKTSEYTLVGSTAAWEKYLNYQKQKNPNFFEPVYYVPVWLESIKQYEDSITSQIGKACENETFKNGDKNIEIIDKVERKNLHVAKLVNQFSSTQAGGRSRKRTRRSKRKNLRNKRTLRSKRKSLRKKRLSKRK